MGLWELSLTSPHRSLNLPLSYALFTFLSLYLSPPVAREGGLTGSDSHHSLWGSFIHYANHWEMSEGFLFTTDPPFTHYSLTYHSLSTNYSSTTHPLSKQHIFIHHPPLPCSSFLTTNLRSHHSYTVHSFTALPLILHLWLKLLTTDSLLNTHSPLTQLLKLMHMLPTINNVFI